MCCSPFKYRLIYLLDSFDDNEGDSNDDDSNNDDDGGCWLRFIYFFKKSLCTEMNWIENWMLLHCYIGLEHAFIYIYAVLIWCIEVFQHEQTESMCVYFGLAISAYAKTFDIQMLICKTNVFNRQFCIQNISLVSVST